MPVILKKYYPVRKILFFFGEGFLIIATILGSYLFFSGWRIFLFDLMPNLLRAGVVTLVFQTCLYFFDLYDLRRPGSASITSTRMALSFGVGCIVLGLIYIFLPQLVISNRIFWISYIIICLEIAGWRFLYYLILERRLFTRPIVIVGSGKLAREISQEIEDNKDSAFTIVGYTGPDATNYTSQPIPVAPTLDQLWHFVPRDKVERIIVALKDRRGTMPIAELLQCKLQGISIDNGINFFEEITGKILVEDVNPAWLIFSDGFERSRTSYYCKRLLDLVASFFGLILSLPMTVPVALLIKYESPGPIFYIQERVGERGEVYKVLKFRSMRQDAEQHGAVWAQQDDPRVTRIGSFIRRTRIDEIPQMYNVLRGEMSFVGPRPERPIFVAQLTESIPYYSLRHSTKPGITGWAQVCYPYGASEEDALRKLEYDLYYIKNRSIFLDLMIIFRTVKTVLFQKGSR